MEPTQSPIRLTEDEQRHGMRSAIRAQCCGALSILAFRYGLVFLLIQSREFSDVWIMLLLACPMVLRSTLAIPGAHFSDRFGIKRLGGGALLLTVVGFACLTMSSQVGDSEARRLVVLGILLYSLGNGLFTSSWFGLLSDVIPANERGKFFGRLRVSWQTVGLVMFVGMTLLFSDDTSPREYGWVFAVITAGMFGRFIFYTRIPEARQEATATRQFWVALRGAMQAEGYLSFCSYVFLLSLMIGGILPVFALIEKKTLAVGDAQIMIFGLLTMIGSLGGFYVGGKMVDQRGTKIVFLMCHFGFALTIFGFLFRSVIPVPLLELIGGLHLCFGFLGAASSIAVSTEMLALIPPTNKSLSTSFATSLQVGGGALSGIFIAGALRMGILRETWTCSGIEFTHYDSILGVCGVSVLLLVVTLGLVPSIVGKNDSYPHAS